MNPFARFETIVAFRFMREGLTQTLLIVFGVALGRRDHLHVGAAGGPAGQHRAPHAQLPGADRNPRPDQIAAAARRRPASVAAQIQPRSQQLRSVDQWQKVLGDVAEMPASRGHTGRCRARLRAARRGDQIGLDHRDRHRFVLRRDRASGEDRRGRDDVGPLDIIIGIELAKDLGMAVGDKLSLTTAAGVATTLTVIGIFDFGNKGPTSATSMCPAHRAELLDLPGGATSIEVKVHDPFAAEKIAQTIRGGTELEVDSWIRTNAQFFSAMAAQILANTLIRVFVGLTVASGSPAFWSFRSSRNRRRSASCGRWARSAPRCCAYS